jgi:DNA-binding NarL/FixJ family response regulator
MSPTLRVLLLEKNAADAEMVKKTLYQAGIKAVLERGDSRDAFIQSLRDFAPHVVVTDQSPPPFDASDALKVLQAVHPVAAMILLPHDLDERLEKLSPGQLQMPRLVAEGHTTGEIARGLKLSAKTVETHGGGLMKRLGVHDVVALVRYAVRVGLVAADI